MQVQVVENQAAIVGKVREIDKDERHADRYRLTVEVQQVESVRSLPNLMESTRGLTIEITITAEDLAYRHIEAGKPYRFRVKKTGPTTVFVIPDEGAEGQTPQ
jgi:hypothetical protein